MTARMFLTGSVSKRPTIGATKDVLLHSSPGRELLLATRFLARGSTSGTLSSRYNTENRGTLLPRSFPVQAFTRYLRKRSAGCRSAGNARVKVYVCGFLP